MHEPTTAAHPDAVPGPAGTDDRPPRLSRVLLLATLCLVVSMFWVRKTSLIAFTILVAEGSPPIPAVAVLVLMSALGFAVHRLARGHRLRREALLIYIVMSLGLVTLEANGVRQLLAQLTVTRYFAAPGNDYALFADLLPSWITPSEESVIRDFYEGSANGRVPWGPWAAPLAAWGLLFMALGLSLVCLNSLFRRPWAEHERLSYPLAELILQVAPPESWERSPTATGGSTASRSVTAPTAARPLLRNPLFWVGVGLAAIYDGSNIAHAFSPQVAAIGQQFDMNPLLSERPWAYLRPMTLTFRPEIIGLGYLVPVDVLLSVWGFFLLFRVENFFASVSGYQIGNFPFERSQGMGAYVGLMVFLMWVGRKHLWQVVQMACGGPRQDWDRQELLPSRLAFWGLVAGIAAVCIFCVSAGMSWGLALTYVLLTYGAALVYIRIRAQTGLPINYMLPREEVLEAILALKPTTGHFDKAGLRSETAYATITVISRMTFPQLGAFEMEGIRIGTRAGLRRSHVLTAITYGLGLGLVLALWMHLTAYYGFGANVLDGGTTSGGYRAAQARSAFDRLQSRAFVGVPMDVRTTAARGVGLALTLVMLWLRARFLRFPLNPLGLGIAGSYGHSIWFPCFMAWMCKTLILRLGGPHTYRVATPVFLGLAIGHILFAGGIWGLVGAFSEDVAKRYLMWFA